MAEAEEIKENIKGNDDYSGLVLKYYPDQRKGLMYKSYRFPTNNYIHRRRHFTLKPEVLKSWKDSPTKWDIQYQTFDLDKDKKNIISRYLKNCLSVIPEPKMDDDLEFSPCGRDREHRQKFWFGQYGDDKNIQNANHIFSEGGPNSRRRRLCVDMGGGRLYLHPCHNGGNQRWIKSYATTTSTTTTTVLEKVRLITGSFPEKIEWIIHDLITKKPVPGCRGKAYSKWYSEHKTGCKLTKGRRYKITCFDKMYKEGWAEAYLKIGKKKICDDFHWDQKKASKVVMYP